MWAILGEQQKKFVIILSQTQRQARQHLLNIKRELETNVLLRIDLGPFKEETDEWGSLSLVIPKYGAKITAASTEQSIRGMRHGEHRPDLVIGDDLEDLESVKTKESRDKLFGWFTGDIIPAGDANTRIIVIGNLLHEDSLLMKLKKNIELRQLNAIFRSFPFMDEGDKLLWPAKFDTLEKIEEEKNKIGNEIAWQREYMLKIIPDEGRVVHTEWLHYYDKLPEFTKENNHRSTIMAVDLAISQGSNADYTAVAAAEVYGYRENLKIFILPTLNKRMTYPETVEMIKGQALVLGQGNQCHIVIEKVGYQEALIQDLDAQGFQVEAFTPHGQDKRARLSLTTHHIRNGQIRFPKTGAEELIQQLVGFGVEKHDDLADSFSMLILKIIEKDNTNGHFTFCSIDDQPTPKIKTEQEKEAERLAVLKSEAERSGDLKFWQKYWHEKAQSEARASWKKYELENYKRMGY